MNALPIFCILCLLLVAGKFLRVRLSLIQRLYLPSSLVGGIIGLILVNCLGRHLPPDLIADMGKVPGFLINIVFATLFLGAATPRFKKILHFAFPQLCLGQVIAWGQYVVGLGVTGFLLMRLSGVPAAFGNLLEIGFEGGPGTVGGMAESFRIFGWEDGIALGYTMSTAGMVIGIVIGMMLVQAAYRRGIVSQVVSFEDRRDFERKGIFTRHRRPAAGFQTVCCDSIDSLAWHISVVGVAVLIGYIIHRLIPMKGFPIFPLCMIGGVMLNLLAKLVRRDLLIDRCQMERISGASLDFLLVAAISTIKLKVVAASWLPLLILIVVGTAWSAGVILLLAPKIFRESWFERAIAEFGQATGVTATGLMLLRSVDPQNRTPAAMSFGYKQLLHEPFMGGGIWTALAFTLVCQYGWFKIFVLSTIMLVIWLAASCAVIRTNRRNSAA